MAGIFIWSIDMDDFSGKFCNMGPYPLIKNSMSLLMEYMPEYYSSNSAKSSLANNNNLMFPKNKKISKTKSFKMFYILK